MFFRKSQPILQHYIKKIEGQAKAKIFLQKRLCPRQLL